MTESENKTDKEAPEAAPEDAATDVAATEEIASGSAVASSDSIGHVVSISGSEAIIVSDIPIEADGSQGVRLEIGAVVRINSGGGLVIGLISGLTIPVPKQDARDEELRVAQVELLGEICLPTAASAEVKFQRGVTSYPALGDKVFEATKEDLQVVYSFPNISTARIGVLHQDASVPAYLAIDDLLGKHFAILGATGTGKSCATALILGKTLEQHEHGHIILLDLHNEYSSAFGDKAEVMTSENLELPYWLLTFEELTEILVNAASETREDEISILAEVVVESKKTFAADEGTTINVDTPIPYRLSDVHRLLEKAMGQLGKTTDSVPYLRLRGRLKSMQNDRRYGFMFQSLTIKDNMSQILSRLFRIPVAGKPMTIIDLSSVPSEILNVVVSVVSRMTFDFALWSKQMVPILLVCEEAHRYAPREQEKGFGPTKQSLARIAKEGRKYGVSLCLVSQRPSELDMTVLSQCSTVIALRIGNRSDRDFVSAAMAESGMGLLEFLPSLRNGEVIAIGEGVPVPVRVMLDRLPAEKLPRGGTASFSEAWNKEGRDMSLDDVVTRWRARKN